MYIGKKKNSKSEYYESYLIERAIKTEQLANILIYVMTPVFIFFFYQDYYILKIPQLIPVRSIVFIPFIFYTIYFKGVKKKNRKATEFFQFLFLSGQMFMYIAMMDLFLTLENGWGAMGSLVREGFFLSEVVLFVFAGMTLRRLPFIFSMTSIGIIVLIALKFSDIDVDTSRIFIADFIAVSTFLSLGSFIQENLSFKAFVSEKELKKELDENIAIRKTLEDAVEQNKSLMDKLEIMAKIDELTGTLTRNAGVERLTDDIERCKNSDYYGTIIFIDVDKLKVVNDTYGHDAGDRLLKHAIKEVNNRMNKDDYIIRFGGDDFLLIMPKSEVFEAEEKIELILENLIKENYSFSYGSVSFDIDGEYDIEKVIQAADKKMYSHKLSKR